ncbi:MAG: MarR family winged helix-turn-helix transcriptional regulator [Zoogloeaceae bacterium]|jgi:DNA-binding MarR family transcriptional regulator|nr:MarR family winged helix-turn-helix transcriptional regulator [Zoogloeaceae bacterium]
MPNKSSPTTLDVLKQFRGIFNAIKLHYQSVESISRITGAQLWSLSVVVRQPGVRVSDLAQMMGVHQSTSSNLVEQLYRQKLLIKQRSDSDQRVVQLFPTESGIAVVQDAPQPLEGILPKALKQLSATDLAQLHALLGKLIALLKTQHTPVNTHVLLNDIAAAPALRTADTPKL